MKSSAQILLLLLAVIACQPMKQGNLSFEDGSVSRPSPSGQKMPDYNLELQMADRTYVESVLYQVFDISGASTAVKNEVYQSIYQRIEFGGACDLYAPSESGAQAEFPRESCVNGIGQVQISTNNATRFSLTSKVCETLIVGTDNRLSAVRSKIYSTNQWAKPDDGSVKRAYRLFYPVGEISQPVVDSLVGFSSIASNDEEAWRGIMLTLCLSPEWQVL